MFVMDSMNNGFLDRHLWRFEYTNQKMLSKRSVYLITIKYGAPIAPIVRYFAVQLVDYYGAARAVNRDIQNWLM